MRDEAKSSNVERVIAMRVMSGCRASESQPNRRSKNESSAGAAGGGQPYKTEGSRHRVRGDLANRMKQTHTRSYPHPEPQRGPRDR